MNSMTLREAAVYYATKGWAVVPLHHVANGKCDCVWEKKPECKSAGKHPLFDDWGTHASNWPIQVEGHWVNYPNANIGIATGKKSGVVCLDVDTKAGKQGAESFAKLCADYNWTPDPNGPRARTGTGGFHYLFAAPDEPIQNTVDTGGYFDIDFRGDGGQFVVAPSVVVAGQYKWEVEPWDEQGNPRPLPKLPYFIEKLVRETPSVKKDKVDASGLNWDAWKNSGAQLPERCRMMVEENQALKDALLLRKPKGNASQNESEIDARIMGYVKACGGATVEECAQVLWYSWDQAGLTARHLEKGACYYANTCALGQADEEPVPQVQTVSFKDQLDAARSRLTVAQATPAVGQTYQRQQPGMLTKEDAEAAFSKLTASIDHQLLTWETSIQNVTPAPSFYTFLEEGNITTLSAVSTGKKTWFCLNLAGHFIEGAPLHADKSKISKALAPHSADPEEDAKGPKSGIVIYLLPDSKADTFKRRIRHWRKSAALELGTNDPAKFLSDRFILVGREKGEPDRFAALYLKNDDGWKFIVRLIERARARWGQEHRVLVIIDTFARMTGGIKEIDPQEQTRMVAAAENIATEGDAAVLLVHHVSQDMHKMKWEDLDPLTYGRGATGLNAAARAKLGMMNLPGFDERVLGIKRRSDTPFNDDLYFEIRDASDSKADGIKFLRPISQEQIDQMMEEQKAAQDEVKAKEKEEEQREQLEAEMKAKPGTLEIRNDVLKKYPAGLATHEQVNAVIEDVWQEKYPGVRKGTIKPWLSKLKKEMISLGIAKEVGSNKSGDLRIDFTPPKIN